MIRNPRKRGGFRDDAADVAGSDVPWNIILPILISLLVAVVYMTIRTPPIEPEDSALYITSYWDPTISEREVAHPDTSRAELLAREKVSLRDGLSRADIDLWVAYIGTDNSCQVVGYPSSMRQTRLLKLDEDDRGWDGSDVKSDINREVVGARAKALPAGTYWVTTHLYSPRGEYVDEANPIVTRLKIVINQGRPDMFTVTWDVKLTNHGQELGVEFRIDDKGNLIPGSVSKAPSDQIRIATGLRNGGRCNQ
ncbi:MAG: hypothetical protein GC134_09395 [Proteobacteria bacterium]|nr:hypothetical protein [Pseudomonadota bacterium]